MGLLIALLMGAVFLRIADPSGIKRLRNVTFDYYNKLAPRPAGSGVIIVDIDEDSLKKLGQWPWPRTVLAEMTRKLHDLGAKSIAFDMVFAEADRTSPELIAGALPVTDEFKGVADKLKSMPNNDLVFAKAVEEADNVVTGFVGTTQGTEMEPLPIAKFVNSGFKPDPLKFVSMSDDFATTLPAISSVAAGNGSFTAEPEGDGIIRRVPLLIGARSRDGSAELLPALSIEALRVALGRKVYDVKSFSERTEDGYGITQIKLGSYTIPTAQDGSLWVYYAGHRPDLYVPAWKVMEGQAAADSFKDKIVLVGTSTIGLLDLRSSPLNAVLPGVEIHAEIIEQILDGKFLQRLSYFDGAELLAAAGVCLLIILFSPFINTLTLAFVCLCLIFGGFTGAFAVYRSFGYLIDPVYPSAMTLTIFILAAMLSNLRTEMEKRQVRTAFGHYLSPVLIEELTKDPDKLKLGGEVRELSVMFTDVRNFTSISETMEPAELIRMMNDFLTPMTTKIMDFRGTVDKYMGDAIMAFWNAPLDDPDHALHACQAALAMRAVLAPLNESLKARAEMQSRIFHPLKIGVGIGTGNCSVGNMGSRQRFAYSALGDTVNLSSRLEGQTKAYGVQSLISNKTQATVKGMAFLEVDMLAVKGRTEPERIFTLMGDEVLAQSSGFIDLKEKHETMIAAYRSRAFDKAIESAVQCAGLDAAREITGLYKLYQERCQSFKNNPPGPDWAGVWIATSK